MTDCHASLITTWPIPAQIVANSTGQGVGNPWPVPDQPLTCTWPGEDLLNDCEGLYLVRVGLGRSWGRLGGGLTEGSWAG